MVLVCLSAATRALAQCGSGYVGLKDVLTQDDVAIVFSGRVASLERAGSTETVTFIADRVWKGPVKEQTTIHKPVPMSGGDDSPPIFERGESYVVIAHRPTATERRGLGIDDREDAFGTDVCGDGSRLLSVARSDLGNMGPGSAPVDERPPGRRLMVAPPLRINDVAPIYPKAAQTAGIRGTVIIEITVDETGRVSRATVLRSIPLLDQAAIDCVMKWEYLPALINGTPQPVTISDVVTFAPEP